jgi:3-phenylpropionate/trans-cinnamate dioxygenase ferredoxin component
VGEVVSVGKVDDILDGEMTSLEAGGVKIAVAQVDGNFYAFDDTCTHRGCSLSEGDIEEHSVVCPCHGGEFDLETGDAIGGPATDPISTYEVRVEDGIVQVVVD